MEPTTQRRRPSAAELAKVQAVARARTLAARALKAVRRASKAPPAPGKPTLTAAQGEALAAPDEERARTATDVARVWAEAARERFGKDYKSPTWTVVQKRWAKLLLAEYGWPLVRDVVEALWAGAKEGDPPTIDLLYAARARAFDAWQLRREVPHLHRARKGGAAESARERKKNFDEWQGPTGVDGGHDD